MAASEERKPLGHPDTHLVVSGRDILRWRFLAIVLSTVLVFLGAALIAVLPRAMAYDDLLEENLALRTRVQELDQRMQEVDRILMRMRVYDAQLRGLAPEGDHGPLGDLPEEYPPDGADTHDDTFPGADDEVAGVVDHVDLRPAGDWADDVLARTDNFLAVFEAAEPDLNALVENLEDVRALEEALPSQWPAGGDMTSDFGYRTSPFGLATQFHRGVDISNDRGTPIVASAPGTVLRASFNGGYGRMVEIDHGYGVTTRYAHLNRILVHKGDQVSRGDQVGTMGRTGRVTGTHLHFEVRIDGHAVDPMDYLPGPLPPE